MYKFITKSVSKNYVPYSVCLCTSTVNTNLNEIGQGLRKIQPKTNEIKSYGQPTPDTHPHLLKPGEFTPGLTLAEFKSRRERFVDKLLSSSNTKKHCVVIPSAKKKYMSGKIPYVFRQNTDFMYMTGCLEPDSCLLLEIDNEKFTSTMFLRPKDKNMEMWDGVVTGLGDPGFFGVDQAIDIADLNNYLDLTFKSSQPDTLWYNTEESEFTRLTSTVKELVKSAWGANLLSPTNLIHQLRLYKSSAEQKLMQKTCQIASEAINETISWSNPDISEHHIFAKVDYECRMRNASYLAYPPVVASGQNATTIHYINNCQMLKTGDTVLMDAGCEYGGYTSDITRTFPVSKSKLSDAQRVLYEIVLETQKSLIRKLQEKAYSLDELFEIMCLELGKYLKEIGFIPKHLSGVDLARASYKYCPHHVSHYLGMDVHDTPSISRAIKLEPGMVFTIEPGLYISADNRVVSEEFRGLGVRIEDDALMLPNNKVQILTEACVKEIKDIER
uniref:CSON011162 protein n=1 Tax=Culicoides sonorensis TaxID=179676 RepID=A0A336M323_CULSO